MMWRVAVIVVAVVLYAGSALCGTTTDGTDSDVQNFRLGAESYRKGDYAGAVDRYTKSLVSKDPTAEMRANYNIGNSKYMAGKKLEQNAPSDALSLYRQSLQYFKRAIELNEKDMDAKVNYELTDKKIRELSEKLKNQPKQDKKQDKQDSAQNDKSKKDKEQNDKDKDKGHKDSAEEGKSPDKSPEGKDKGSSPRHEQQGQVGKDDAQRPDTATPRRVPGTMTKEEAEMLLEGLRYLQSGNVLKDKETQKPPPPVLKDW
ncbi:MAG: hypothetical protein SFH39_03145 [Candidatus Magnetobacterium sp. LHC-1]|nr:hypothetical protein [Nitrospirota bacterium]